jgi:trans-2,3-dihydro-3-hydroxyanthranilate isomerase
MKLPLHHVDVFTAERFGGNPLAVFLDADGLDEALMRRIAREMNLSETTFVLKPANPRATHRARIFTPNREMPFAGHPTIGTSYVLQRCGLAGDALDLELQAGVVPVRTEEGRLWMTPPQAEAIGAAYDRAEIARSLGVSAASVLAPPQNFGARGVDFLCVLLDGESTVDAVAPQSVEDHLLVFSYQAGRAYSRMICRDGIGIMEDPATGSSVAPLCTALGAWRALDPARTELTVTQGVAMGRPSTIYARFTLHENAVTGVTIGGSSVPVYESVLEL